ncbi:copper-resistant cuproprotein CopI [Vibrio scophthalmi]|uniref:copper-resistant cuproprotein CopI n=1 Tax=Vibrio scophthalmi TaxID=45658 RepID=UPI003EBE4C21
MKLVILISLMLSTSFAYANMDHSKMDHSNTDHSNMSHSQMQSMPGMTQVGMPAQGAKADKVIHVILSDDKPIQFKKDVNIEENDVVQFVIMNSGTTSHEFAIGSKDELSRHHKMMAQMAGMEHDTSSSIIVAPKKARQFTWHFHGDKHVELACNINGHQQHSKSLMIN